MVRKVSFALALVAGSIVVHGVLVACSSATSPAGNGSAVPDANAQVTTGASSCKQWEVRQFLPKSYYSVPITNKTEADTVNSVTGFDPFTLEEGWEPFSGHVQGWFGSVLARRCTKTN